VTHDEAVGLLTSFVTGRLSDAQQREMQEHFQSCEECRGLVDTLRLLRGPLRDGDPERGPAGHASSAGLVRFALERDELSAQARQELTAHLADCRSCRQIVDLVAETGATGHEDEGPSGLGWWWPRAALAAAAVATAGLAWLGLYRVPRLKDQIAALEAGRPAAFDSRAPGEAPDVVRGGSIVVPGSPGEPFSGPSGPIRVQALPPTLRGGPEPLAQVTLTGDDQTLYLAVQVPDLPGSGDRPWTFAVIGAGEEPLWSQTTSADELRRLNQASPELVLAIPAALMPAGRQLLRLEAADQAGSPFVEIPFLVKRLPALNPGKH
jgi:hypothetical protein